jgi:hypothetical protein
MKWFQFNNDGPVAWLSKDEVKEYKNTLNRFGVEYSLNEITYQQAMEWVKNNRDFYKEMKELL